MSRAKPRPTFFISRSIPSNPTRLAAAFGLVLLHAGVIWGAAVPTRLLAVGRRHARSKSHYPLVVAGWVFGMGLGAWLGVAVAGPLPVDWLVLAAGASGLAALSMGRPRGATRRASQAARLGLLYLALLVPAAAIYPTLNAFASDAKERLVADNYGPLAVSQREVLKQRLSNTLEQIDSGPGLGRLPEPNEGGPPAKQTRPPSL